MRGTQVKGKPQCFGAQMKSAVCELNCVCVCDSVVFCTRLLMSDSSAVYELHVVASAHWAFLRLIKPRLMSLQCWWQHKCWGLKVFTVPTFVKLVYCIIYLTGFHRTGVYVELINCYKIHFRQLAYARITQEFLSQQSQHICGIAFACLTHGLHSSETALGASGADSLLKSETALLRGSTQARSY